LICYLKYSWKMTKEKGLFFSMKNLKGGAMRAIAVEEDE
jgi:hypothetical protein